MKKRNEIILIVIALLTFLAATAGATFAYFAGTKMKDNYTNVLATSSASHSLFDTIGSSIDIAITKEDMYKDSSGGTPIVNRTTDLTVHYLSGTASSKTCSYDLFYKWGEDSVYLINDFNDEPREFTYQVTCSDENQNANLPAQEKNFLSTKVAGSKVKVNTNKLQVQSSSVDDRTTQVYTIRVRFYNLEGVNQGSNSKKNLKIVFFVDEISCS